MSDKIFCQIWTHPRYRRPYREFTYDEWMRHTGVDSQRLHRLDGPAIVYSEGSNEWWIDGKPLPRLDVEKWIQENDIDLSTQEGQTAFALRWK